MQHPTEELEDEHARHTERNEPDAKTTGKLE